MSRHRILVITDASAGSVRERFVPRDGEVFVRARTLDEIDRELPKAEGVVIDADELSDNALRTPAQEFFWAVRNRALYHRKPVVALTQSPLTKSLAESERIATAMLPRGAVDFALSWAAAQENRRKGAPGCGQKEKAGAPFVAPVGSSNWRPMGRMQGYVLMVVPGGDIGLTGTADPDSNWGRLARALRGEPPAESEMVIPDCKFQIPELEREFVDLTLLAMDAKTATQRNMAREMAGRVAARLPKGSEVAACR